MKEFIHEIYPAIIENGGVGSAARTMAIFKNILNDSETKRTSKSFHRILFFSIFCPFSQRKKRAVDYTKTNKKINR